MTDEPKSLELPVAATLIITVISTVAALPFDKNLATAFTALGAIATAVLSFVKSRSTDKNARRVANIAANALVLTNSRSVFAERVTAERAVWRSELRGLGSCLVTLLRWSARRQKIDWQEALRCASGIRLRLNPLGRGAAPAGIDLHPLDREAHHLLDEIMATSPRDRGDHRRFADALEIVLAKLLKQEWDKSKSEATAGRALGQTKDSSDVTHVMG